MLTLTLRQPKCYRLSKDFSFSFLFFLFFSKTIRYAVDVIRFTPHSNITQSNTRKEEYISNVTQIFYR